MNRYQVVEYVRLLVAEGFSYFGLPAIEPEIHILPSQNDPDQDVVTWACIKLDRTAPLRFGGKVTYRRGDVPNMHTIRRQLAKLLANQWFE